MGVPDPDSADLDQQIHDLQMATKTPEERRAMIKALANLPPTEPLAEPESH
jgi:hypothetical protein